MRIGTQMHQPRLEVFGWDEQGAPRLLRRAGSAPGEPSRKSSKVIDAAGYVCARYEAAYDCPWGTALVLCKHAQDGFWSKWAGAFAAQGLEVRKYLVEDLWRSTPDDDGAWPTLSESSWPHR